MTIKRGTYKIIRTDGSEELIQQKPTIPVILKQISADTIDTVNLRQNSVVMILDDNGHLCEPPKPVNPKATALYHAVCVPSTTHQIVGDVALVNDEDFA